MVHRPVSADWKESCFSIDGAHVFGKFSQRFALVSLGDIASAPSAENVREAIRTDAAAAKKLALLRYAPVHEHRHFLDAFGTAAGLCAFRLHFVAAMEFAKFKSRYAGKLPPPPLVHHYRDADCSGELRAFLRRFRLIDQCIGMICAAPRPVFSQEVSHWSQALVEFETGHTALHETLDLSPPTVICFPQAIVLLVNDGKEVRVTRYIPVDFGTLTEANSQMLQRELAFHEVGQELREALVSGNLTVETSGSVGSALNRIPVPYDTIDFLLGRVAKVHGGTAHIDPDTIFRVTEWAMNRTKIVALGDRSAVVADVPAQALASLVNNKLTPQLLNGGPLELNEIMPPVIAKAWLDYIDSLPLWTDVPEDGSLESPLLILYSYVMKEVGRTATAHSKVRSRIPATIHHIARLSGAQQGAAPSVHTSAQGRNQC